MKLTEEERRAVKAGMANPILESLVCVLEESPITRAHLCGAVAGIVLAESQGDEAVAREVLYRIINVYEAAAAGELDL